MCNVHLLIQKRLHANIYLTLLLGAEFNSLLEISGPSRLLHHNNIGVLANGLLQRLRVGPGIELAAGLGLGHARVVGC